MRLAMLIAVLTLFSVSGFSDTLHVPKDYSKIQEAIDAAVHGDVVLVAPGTYVENIDFKGKAIEVAGSDGPDATIIDGNQAGSVVTLQSGEQQDSVLSGFFLTNGFSQNGSGIYCLNSAPTLVNNVISGNEASGGSGGGIYCEGDSPMIADNVISSNIADYYGGGIECSQASATLVNNIISNNSAALSGGGIGHWDCSTTIANNIIFGNDAARGGGVGCGKSSPDLSNNTIFANSADEGGGLYGHFESNPVVVNTVLWNNAASTAGKEAWIGNSSSLTISFCDLEGGQASVHVEPDSTLDWGAGMIDANPLFVDTAIGDFHLTFTSPCKDVGDNSAVTEVMDFEGDPRIAYGTVDMGADEFHTHLYWTGDATPGGYVELKFVGLPGTTPVQLWLGSGVLDPPWSTKYGDWYLEFPLLAHVALSPIPSPDGVLVFPFTFPADTPTPLTFPFQAGIGLELTNLSLMEVK